MFCLIPRFLRILVIVSTVEGSPRTEELFGIDLVAGHETENVCHQLELVRAYSTASAVIVHMCMLESHSVLHAGRKLLRLLLLGKIGS